MGRSYGEDRLYHKNLNAKEEVNMILLDGLSIKTVCLVEKENDRKVGLRYNGDMIHSMKADIEWKVVSVLWHIRIKKTI